MIYGNPIQIGNSVIPAKAGILGVVGAVRVHNQNCADSKGKLRESL